MTGRPFTREGDLLRLAVRVTAKAGRDAIAGVIVTSEGKPALAVRLVAAPVEGAANKALVAFLARTLGVPKSSVRIAIGETRRLKIVEIAGVSTETLERLI